MKPQEFRRQVDAGKIPPVVFLIGDDEYIRRDLIEQLKKKVLAGADALTALELWDGEEQSLEEVLWRFPKTIDHKQCRRVSCRG
jgi:DNA polymerase III delta subunit